MKTYSEMLTFPTFKERFSYLKLNGVVADPTFGYERYLNQTLYRSEEWKKVRRAVIIRDSGCDLASLDREIGSGDRVLIHHINPITRDDILNRSPSIFDMDNLVCCSEKTHNAIHYGNESLVLLDVAERSPGDTCPWKM